MGSGVLAPHHVRRANLVETALSSAVTVVEAGGGFGKTSLTMEIAEAVPDALVVSLPPGCQPAELAAAVARAARLRGDDELSDRLALGATDQADALVAAFRAAPAGRVLVIDDIEHASPDSARMLVAVGQALAAPHRLILVGRTLPVDADALERLPHVRRLTVNDLTLSPEDVGVAARTGFGLDLDDDEVAALHAATGGWAAAVVMACGRAAGAGGHLDLGAAGTADVLEELVGRLRVQLDDRDRWAATQLAHLLRFDDTIVAATVGSDALHRLVAAGLALTTVGMGWRRLVGPLADRIVTWGELDQQVARDVAAQYARRGFALDGVRLLLSCNLDDEAIAMLREAADGGELDAADLVAATNGFGQALARYPALWLVRARALFDLWSWDERATALDRLADLLAESPDQDLQRALGAERAIDLAMADGRAAEAVRVAEEVLDGATDLEPITRLHALEALGRGLAFEPDPRQRRRAKDVLEQARSLSASLGSPRRQVLATIVYAKMVLYPAGDAGALLAAYDEVFPLTRPLSRLRAILQIYRLEALVDLGDDAALDEAFEETERIGRRLDDRRVLAHVNWLGAMRACHAGDAEATLRLLRETERLIPDGLDRKIGILLYRDSAEQCLKIGRPDLARRYLQRLDDVEGIDGEGAGYLHQARAFHDALHGDADAAVAALDHLDQQYPNPRESWRRHLHRAAAFERLGDHRAASEASTAFDIANRLGGPALATRREPLLAARMQALVVATGDGTRPTGSATQTAVSVSALGQFRVQIDGQDATPAPGRPTDLLQLLIAAGGSARADTIMAALWPDSSHERSLRSLRNTLHRLAHRDQLVDRHGTALIIPDAVDLDARRFHAEARRVQAQLRTDPDVAVGAAIRVLSTYTGPLLPGVSLPLVEEARDDLSWLAAGLADGAARAARSLKRTVDAEVLLRHGIRIEPSNEGRRLALARLLTDTGRQLDARRVLEELRDHTAELGLAPGPAVEALDRQLRGA